MYDIVVTELGDLMVILDILKGPGRFSPVWWGKKA